jgi:N-acetylglucosamine kinase-like BadF-type ATPase
MGKFLAIDAGGTKTRCWVADDERVLADVSAGTVKLMQVSETVATERLRDLVLGALEAAGVAPKEVTRTVIGLAGSSSERVQAWVRSVLDEVVGGEMTLVGDEVIGLDAAFHGGPGVLVIAGTGSNVIGRCADGRIVSAGGWGPVLGDEGSGFWIGLEAIRAALRAKDRGLESSLLPAIQEYWGLRDLGSLVAHANARERVAFAELTALVVRCAAEGDHVAASVLERAGQDLAAQVGVVAAKMTASGCDAAERLRVAYVGSVLAKIERVSSALQHSLRELLPGVDILPEAVEPLEGALWQARKAT